MPLFSSSSKEKKKSTKEKDQGPTTGENHDHQAGQEDPPSSPRPKLVFHCQMAQGSPTGIISGFTNVKELYQKISACFDMDASEILFCTLNTHKIDMTRLLGGQLGLEDFIFAHVKGRPKAVDIDKTEDALGLTITDNGAGIAFIKAIKEGSIISKIEGILVGDQIEKINNISMIGSRHFEVAKMLKEIPKGSTFSLRLVEPQKSGFSEIGGKSMAKKAGGYGSGKETLRLRSKGPATVEIPDDISNVAIEKINSLLDGFLGISDAELAQSIWEIGSQKNNPSEFALAIDNSELQEFSFTDAFVFDLWGAISDAKQGRLKKAQEFNENF